MLTEPPEKPSTCQSPLNSQYIVIMFYLLNDYFFKSISNELRKMFELALINRLAGMQMLSVCSLYMPK